MMPRAAGFLSLVVLSVSAEGVPRLAGTNRRVIATTRFGPGDVGRQAVCQPVEGDDDLIVALGVLRGSAERAETAEQPLELRAGKAGLRLDPDGRITLTGARFDITTDGPFRLRSSRIDLN